MRCVTCKPLAQCLSGTWAHKGVARMYGPCCSLRAAPPLFSQPNAAEMRSPSSVASCLMLADAATAACTPGISLKHEVLGEAIQRVLPVMDAVALVPTGRPAGNAIFAESLPADVHVYTLTCCAQQHAYRCADRDEARQCPLARCSHRHEIAWRSIDEIRQWPRPMASSTPTLVIALG